MDLELLKRFYVVAEEGTLTKASKRINITQSALSKSVSYFEDRLKTYLFTRNGKGMELTPQGVRLYHHAKKILLENELFEREFLEDRTKVQGDLRVLIYPYMGSEWLVPNVKGFLDLYPDIRLKIHLDPERLLPLQADVAIGAYIQNQPYLIQKELWTLPTHFFASEEYLDKFGTPETPEDLDHHRLIAYKDVNHFSGYQMFNLLLNIGIKTYDPPRRPYLEVNSLNGMINAAQAGYGIVELPAFPAIVNSGLKIVLPKIKGDRLYAYFIFHENRRNSIKIQIFYEYLLGKVAEEMKK